jgi:hypothetical protein
MIGLMGTDGYGMLYSPNGTYLMRIPFGRAYGWRGNIARWIARNIQGIQHWIARKTWTN